MSKMTKPELISALSDATGLSAAAVNSVMTALGPVVTAAAVAGRVVPIPGIGMIAAVEKAARIGRNPKTGEAVEVPARRAAKFTAARALKDGVNV